MDGKNKRNKSTQLVASNSGHLWLKDTSNTRNACRALQSENVPSPFFAVWTHAVAFISSCFFKLPSAGQHLEVRTKSCVCMYLKFFSRRLPHHILLFFNLLRLFFPSTASIRGWTGGRETEWMGRMVGPSAKRQMAGGPSAKRQRGKEPSCGCGTTKGGETPSAERLRAGRHPLRNDEEGGGGNLCGTTKDGRTFCETTKGGGTLCETTKSGKTLCETTKGGEPRQQNITKDEIGQRRHFAKRQRAVIPWRTDKTR